MGKLCNIRPDVRRFAERLFNPPATPARCRPDFVNHAVNPMGLLGLAAHWVYRTLAKTQVARYLGYVDRPLV